MDSAAGMMDPENVLCLLRTDRFIEELHSEDILTKEKVAQVSEKVIRCLFLQ